MCAFAFIYFHILMHKPSYSYLLKKCTCHPQPFPITKWCLIKHLFHDGKLIVINNSTKWINVTLTKIPIKINERIRMIMGIIETLHFYLAGGWRVFYRTCFYKPTLISSIIYKLSWRGTLAINCLVLFDYHYFLNDINDNYVIIISFIVCYSLGFYMSYIWCQYVVNKTEMFNYNNTDGISANLDLVYAYNF